MRNRPRNRSKTLQKLVGYPKVTVKWIKKTSNIILLGTNDCNFHTGTWKQTRYKYY